MNNSKSTKQKSFSTLVSKHIQVRKIAERDEFLHNKIINRKQEGAELMNIESFRIFEDNLYIIFLVGMQASDLKLRVLWQKK